ncbi:D-alanyl-D-alanine carboxypeptidase [Anaerotaenia torta]|uniref:M15 family metallopeptidase n=1 Tax=Anaerotaenia torta TaxID=433293 RepID=UPI003D190513
MKKRQRKHILIASFAASLTLLSGVVFVNISQARGNTGIIPTGGTFPGVHETKMAGEDTYTTPIPAGAEASPDDSVSVDPSANAEETFVPATEMDLDPSSLTVFVNKEYALPKDYRPDELVTPNVAFNLISYDERTLMRPEAAEALEKLFDAAKQDGIILYGISGFRSYQRQASIFTSNIVKRGKKYTLRYSAVPGTSEHQTGLAIDVSAKSLGFKLSTGFSSSPEGIWLADNAHHYGYIIRYPKGDEEITGYAYEPWHIRYVGTALADYLYTNQLTLEEYYHYTPSPDFDFEAVYADFINYTPPKVTEVPLEEDEIIVDENGNVIEGTPDDSLENPEEEGEDNVPGDVPEQPSDPEEEVPEEEEDTEEIPKENETTQVPEQPSEEETGYETDDDGITDVPEVTEPAAPTPTVIPFSTAAPGPTATPSPLPEQDGL